MPAFVQSPLFLAFSYAGVAVFAASGAIAAARQKHDIVTFIFFAALTGVGGGSLRDVLLDTPVFWITDPNHLLISAGVGAALWLIGFPERPLKALLWLDAIGLAVFGILGSAKALALGISPPVAVVMGVLTAAAGGIVRDVTAGEPSVLLRGEVNVTAALAGCTAFVLADPLFGREGASLLGIALIFAIRAGAILWGWSLPEYRGGFWRRRPD
jgi:uncharacterized membrane protein YeiH